MQYTNTHRVNLHQQQAPTATAFTSGPSSSSSDRRRQRLPPPLHAATQQPDHKQLAAPLLDAVLARGNQLQETPLHVPGHKRGRALDPGMQQLLGVPGPDTAQHAQQASSPLRCDLTELAGLDYLSSPCSVIKAAQDLAASAFGAQHTWFLVNGCSVAIHAAVMATVRPGQAILLARNCHLSAFSACVLCDSVPVWLAPEQDSLHGIAHCVQPQQLQAGFQEAKQRGLQVGAVLIVSPTYYGAVARVQELASICHQEGVPLLVDEAHGGHLGPMAADVLRAASASVQQQQPPTTSTTAASVQARQQSPAAGCVQECQQNNNSHQPSSIPLSALQAGADLVMHSSHKVLTAMTQAAMLHLSADARVQPSRISKALQVLQTSSPSYILLASLDAARRHAFAPGSWLAPLAAADAARVQLAGVAGLVLLQDGSCAAQESVAGFDPLRLVVNVQELGVSGYDAAAWLEEQHGVVPELATQKLVVFVFGPGSTLADASKLAEACQQLSALHATKGSEGRAGSQQPKQRSQPCDTRGGSADSSRSSSSSSSQGNTGAQPQLSPVHGAAALTPRQAFFADTEAVALQAAAGRVSAELLCPYPPGVPVVFPGERFTPDTIRLLQQTLAGGGVVTGAQDGSLRTVLVVVPSGAD